MKKVLLRLISFCGFSNKSAEEKSALHLKRKTANQVQSFKADALKKDNGINGEIKETTLRFSDKIQFQFPFHDTTELDAQISLLEKEIKQNDCKTPPLGFRAPQYSV